jgi:phosphomannomutase
MSHAGQKHGLAVPTHMPAESPATKRPKPAQIQHSRQDTVLLFDMDGTVTSSRNPITPEMHQVLQQLRKVVNVGVVSGSDLNKLREQLGPNLLNEYDFVFAENGLVTYAGGKEVHRNSIKDFLGEEKIKKLVNFALHYIADLDIPKKRGTFVEFRSGMINICPIGRNCSQEERDEFEQYDNVHHIRQAFVKELETRFPELGLQYSIGGQISFDCFPKGWDKTYCLTFVEKQFQHVYFFGDRTYKGGNDHELWSHEAVHGYTVENPDHTARILKEKFLK